jgi:hypothetical protein
MANIITFEGATMAKAKKSCPCGVVKSGPRKGRCRKPKKGGGCKKRPRR